MKIIPRASSFPGLMVILMSLSKNMEKLLKNLPNNQKPLKVYNIKSA